MKIYLLVFALVALIAGGCSSDKDAVNNNSTLGNSPTGLGGSTPPN